MSEVTLVAQTGRPTGTRSSRRLRATGAVPAVVYGQGRESVALTVDHRELRRAMTGPAGHNALVTLVVDGEPQLTVVRSLQRDPVKRTVTHVDFLRVSADEAIEVEVPIVLEGEAEQVTRADGLVDPALNSLTILAKPGDIPPNVTIDISNLTIGEAIRVGDLVLPPGVTTPLDPDTPVVVATATRAAVAAEGEEAGEGEAAEGQAGEAGEAE